MTHARHWVYTVKPVYNGQPQGIRNVAFVDRGPLLWALETTYSIFTGRIKTHALVNRKPLLAGDL